MDDAIYKTSRPFAKGYTNNLKKQHKTCTILKLDFTEKCNETLADIVFVLDSSGSLGKDNFGRVKQFVINIVNALDIGENLTHVGVITYSNYPTRRIKLDQFTTKQDLVKAIAQIPYYPGNN